MVESRKLHKTKKKKHKEKQRTRHHRSSHRREKHSKNHTKSRKDKKKPVSDDEDFDDDDESDEEILDTMDDCLNSLRRSDRIKVIETKKQYNKELEIAEKVKKLSHFNNDADKGSNQDSESTKDSIRDSPLNGDIPSPAKSISSSSTLVKHESAEASQQIEWPSGYEQIDENLYLCKRQNNKNKESKKMICDCTYSEQEKQLGAVACGSDCLNRMLLIECGNRYF
jgi:hypothetical protein